MKQLSHSYYSEKKKTFEGTNKIIVIVVFFPTFIDILTRTNNEFPLKTNCLPSIDRVSQNTYKLSVIFWTPVNFRRHIRLSTDVQVALFNRSSGLLKASSTTTTTDKTAVEQDDKPIKYFGSQAASWSARQSHHNPNIGDEVWYQPLVISGSLAIFLIYFCILREENDVDAKLDMSLYDRIEGLEELQLEASIKYNKGNGLSTLELEKRLKELRPDTT